MKLDGKVAVVTGGTSGMALATAEKFIAEGAFVYVTGRRQDALDKAVELLGPRGRGIVADSSTVDDLDRLFGMVGAESGLLDVLFVSTGTSDNHRLPDVTPEGFDRVFDLNVRGTLFTAQKAAVLMTDGGSIILNGSVAAVMAERGSSVYAASKAALVAFARVWSAERGIRVNVLHPGPIDTPAMAELPADLRDKRTALTVLGRLGQPREIADAALFLASDDSSFVTGTELFVSGGMEQGSTRD